MTSRFFSEAYDPLRVAEVIGGELQQVIEEKGRASLAIPGGRSPGPTLTELASKIPEKVRRRLSLFWVDERGVPPGHKDRNDAATLATWGEGGPLPGHIYPMPAESPDLEQAAREYGETLNEMTGGDELDACLLGIGEDGHIASLFPLHPVLDRQETVAAVYDSPKPPALRLTLTLPVINRARLRIVLAPGELKGSVFRRSLLGPDPSLPASLLCPGRTIWFVDCPEL